MCEILATPAQGRLASVAAESERAFASFRKAILRTSRQGTGRITLHLDSAVRLDLRQTVAIHEAYRLSRSGRGDARLEELGALDGWDAVIADSRALDTLEARAALRLLAELPEREREDLALLVAGFSYREIAELTGGRTFTKVSKHLAEPAHACVRAPRRANTCLSRSRRGSCSA